MSPRSLFIIILRILGILSVRTLVLVFFQTISNIYLLTQLSDDDILYSAVIPGIFTTAIYFAVSWVLIFKAAYLVDHFKLSRDISPMLQFRFDKRDALRIAVVVTGAILLVNELPTFIANLAHMFDREPQSMFRQRVERSWSPVIQSLAQALIGLLLIGERARIVDILLNDSINNPTDDPEHPAGEEGNKDLFPEQL